MKRILSLGAGIQSSTVFLMAVKGLLPRFNAVIFADTGWEPNLVYRHLAALKEIGEATGMPVTVVSRGNIRQDTLVSQVNGRKSEGKRFASMPFFVLKDGATQMIRRQCTKEYKIEPIERHIKREILGLRPRQRAPKEIVVEQFFGISVDEVFRLHDSRVSWKRHVFPLCGYPVKYLPKEFSRDDCRIWLRENFPNLDVPRSACLGCPFHNDREWREIRNNPDEWKDVVGFDRQIRRMHRMQFPVFLHRSARPLDEIDFRSAEEMGQNNFLNDCTGMCGV